LSCCLVAFPNCFDSLPFVSKGKRKAVSLEYMVAKQNGVIGDLKDALLQASAEQKVSLANNQLTSLTFQRTLSRTRVRDLETSHVKELEQLRSTSTKEKGVSMNLDLLQTVCSS
jgi:hypothetical protein